MDIASLFTKKTLLTQECWTVVALLAICLVLFFVLMLRVIWDVQVEFLTRDPASISDTSSFAGIISNLGVLIWTCAGAICFFTAGLIRDVVEKRFLVISGLFTILLAADDLLMLHERVFPHQIGISEHAIYGIYLLLALIYLWAYTRYILGATRWLFFVLAGTLLSISLAVDAAELRFLGNFFVEDGFKLLGITCWSIYYVQCCQLFIQREIRN